MFLLGQGFQHCAFIFGAHLKACHVDDEHPQIVNIGEILCELRDLHHQLGIVDLVSFGIETCDDFLFQAD